MKHSIFALILTLFSTLTIAAPSADLWDHWQASNPQSSQTIDHSIWDQWLKTYIKPGDDGINYVAYGEVSAADKAKLTEYINDLEATEIASYNSAEQQAYWINLYNALTIDVILQHYPTDSILDIDISPGLLSNGPWKKKLLTIDGQEVSLDDIEHRILRPIWQDPRIHYAVNCASIGCPNLSIDAFTAANTEDLLNQGAKAYINHERGVSVQGRDLVLSSIYDWFESDFGDNDEEVIDHLKQYADAELKAKLEKIDEIDDYDYDWDLNEE